MTTFGGHSVPFTIGEGGGGSFFVSPLRLFDQEYHGIDGIATGIDYRMQSGNLLVQKEVDNTFPLVPNQPQWNTVPDVLPAYSVQAITLEGDGTPDLAFPALGVWRNAQITTTTFGMLRPPPSTSQFITFRMQFAETLNLGTILASALMTLRWTIS